MNANGYWTMDDLKAAIKRPFKKKPVCGVDGFLCGKAICRACRHREYDELRKELDAALVILKAEEAKREAIYQGVIDSRNILLKAVMKIANPSDDCGCSPCMGACRGDETAEIELEFVRDIAAEALEKAIKASEVPS